MIRWRNWRISPRRPPLFRAQHSIRQTPTLLCRVVNAVPTPPPFPSSVAPHNKSHFDSSRSLQSAPLPPKKP